MPANAILVVGDSGSGKSTAASHLPPAETFIINVSAKPLPFRGWKKKYTELNKDNPKGNLMNTDNADMIVKTIKYISTDRPEIKYIVIDDSQYVAANEYMRKINEKGFEKFTSIASNIYKIPMATKDKDVRDDLFVFFMSHADSAQNADGIEYQRAKTLGKMINNNITYEGLFTIVLFTYKKMVKNDTEYGFITNGDPGSTAKSPMGMFPKEIPNNLFEVVEGIKKYEEGE